MANESGLFVLGGVTVPANSILDWSQSRQIIASESVLEYSDLSMEVQQGPTSATKIALSWTCSGWMPPGLDALSRLTTHSLQYEHPTGLNTWETRTITVWITERPRYVENLRAPGGGSVSWTLAVRQA
jgi:hypothetical protein